MNGLPEPVRMTITVCAPEDKVTGMPAHAAATVILFERELTLVAGATVADACAILVAQGLVIDRPQVCGIWGQVVSGNAALKNGDRLEFYQALIADPKATRRRRALETPPSNAPEGRSIYARGNKKRRVGTKPKV